MTDGCLIDLDKGQGQIDSAILTDSIYYACCELKIEFESHDFLPFDGSPNKYLTYMNNKWSTSSYLVSKTQNNTWHYVCTCFPFSYFEVIKKPTINTSMLASVMGLSMVEGSKSLEIDCPIINKTPIECVHQYRMNSLNDAFNKQDMGDAMFIYFTSNGLYSNTYRSILKQKAHIFENQISGIGVDVPKFADDRNELYLKSNRGCHHWTQNDFLNKMLGRKFDIISPNNAYFMQTYTMRFENIPEFDTGTSFLCIRSELNVAKNCGFVNTFAEVLYV